MVDVYGSFYEPKGRRSHRTSQGYGTSWPELRLQPLLLCLSPFPQSRGPQAARQGRGVGLVEAGVPENVWGFILNPYSPETKR